MSRRFFILAIAVCALVAGGADRAALAQDTALTAPEVQHLLSGNTAEGQWDGAHYKSYFDADGTTIYAPANDDPLRGKWRVNAQTGQYESFFDAVGWTGYTVLRTDAGFAWQHDGQSYPFSVVEGRDLAF